MEEINKVKARLTELVDDVLQYLPWGEITTHTAEDVAEYMMQNGVTISEWISVKDRLPEVFVPVLVKYLNYNDGSASPTNVDTAVLLEGDVWYWWEGDLADCDDEVKCTVTHWMPMPKPPKGE